MADQTGAGGGSGSMAASGGGLVREYRKGNWTVQETMVLIEAKRMDDERRLKRASSSSSSTEQQEQLGGVSSSSNHQGMMIMMMRNKPASQLRWKWVEDYCWTRDCFRSQNQCNDKWDNLMRDYKKVRDYERKVAAEQQQQSCVIIAPGSSSSSSSPAPTPNPLVISRNNVSYWSMEKAERKDRGLPSNMLPQIYEALVQVVDKKASSSSAIISSPSTSRPTAATVQAAPLPTVPFPAAALSSPLLQHINVSIAAALPQIAGTPPPPPPPFSQPTLYQTTTVHDSSDSDTSSDSPAKRRRKDKGPETRAGPSITEAEAAVANAISRGASSIAETIQASDGRQERRHGELLRLSQRRIEIEESSVEVNRQGMNGLVGAINNLSNSILALAASCSRQTPPPPPR